MWYQSQLRGSFFFGGGGNGRKFGWEEERGGRGLIVSPLVYRREGSGLGRSGMGGGGKDFTE